MYICVLSNWLPKIVNIIVISTSESVITYQIVVDSQRSLSTPCGHHTFVNCEPLREDCNLCKTSGSLSAKYLALHAGIV